MTLVLTQEWRPGPTDSTPGDGALGAIQMRIANLGPAPVRAVRLNYASMTRPGWSPRLEGAQLETRVANHVQLLPPAGEIEIAPGASWEITLSGLSHAPNNRTQGVMAAWIDHPDGGHTLVRCTDLRCPGAAAGPVKDWPQGTLPQLALLPWPAEAQLGGWLPAQPYCPGTDMDLTAFEQVAALHQRLFPTAANALSHSAGRPVSRREAPMAQGAYGLSFAADGAVMLSHGDADGLRHGLIALAQIAHGAMAAPGCLCPAEAQITDSPRFDWRGCHIDVARNFRPMADVTRLADIMAWHRMNKLHLHLTDDEAWRLESTAYPALTQVGARRARGTAMPPQYADGPGGQEGHYTQAEMRALIAHCAAQGIEVMPEIDLPGHTYALMQAIDGLQDPDEPADSYRSIQGYPNNALNPALPRTYEVVEALLDEICAIFPCELIHVGADEVDANAWHQSPLAQALRRTEGLAEGAMALQAHFLTRVQAMLRARGRRLAGWDECAEGGGIDRAGTLLFAWRSTEKTAELLAEGYEVVATPGQAYYTDMVQGAGWDAIGTSWAGVVPPERCYAYEVSDGLPGLEGLRGVQAGIWSEHLNSRARWNEMVFPRLSAVAEAAWTPPGHKDWDRFCALSRLMPQL